MDERSWEGLLESAFAVLDELCDAGLGSRDVVRDSGTVSMMRMYHPVSRDIDPFLHDAQWLARLTPRLNGHVARWCATIRSRPIP